MTREMTAALDVTVTEPGQVEFQLAVAALPGARVQESLSITSDGQPLKAQELLLRTGSRMHIVQAPVGQLQVRYQASVAGSVEPPPVTQKHLIEYSRPSRYVESDRFADIANAEFSGVTEPAKLLELVASWVGATLSYVPGSSGPMDGATDTMDSRRGVCRDYAHLVTALLRARGLAARVVAVYAPGCDPMDFHAVVEAAVDGKWCVVDGTLLAPRQSLVRICTGRDAADTAFMSNSTGSMILDYTEVTAVVTEGLPLDDISELVQIS